MKNVKKDVKSGGKSLGMIEVPQFESTAEAIKDLDEDKVLSLLNRQYASDFTNEFRASQTREISPMTKLTKMAKTNPELQKRIDALIIKYAAAAETGNTSAPTAGAPTA